MNPSAISGEKGIAKKDCQEPETQWTQWTFSPVTSGFAVGVEGLEPPTSAL